MSVHLIHLSPRYIIEINRKRFSYDFYLNITEDEAGELYEQLGEKLNVNNLPIGAAAKKIAELRGIIHEKDKEFERLSGLLKPHNGLTAEEKQTIIDRLEMENIQLKEHHAKTCNDIKQYIMHPE